MMVMTSVCFHDLLFCNCSIYVVIFSIFLVADVSALVPFCLAQFNVTQLSIFVRLSLSKINDDDDDILT